MMFGDYKCQWQRKFFIKWWFHSRYTNVSEWDHEMCSRFLIIDFPNQPALILILFALKYIYKEVALYHKKIVNIDLPKIRFVSNIKIYLGKQLIDIDHFYPQKGFMKLLWFQHRQLTIQYVKILIGFTPPHNTIKTASSLNLNVLFILRIFTK